MLQTELNRRRIMSAGGGVEPEIKALKFTLLQDSAGGTISFDIPYSVKTTDLQYIEYSKNGKDWVRTDNVDNTSVVVTSPQLVSGESIYFRGLGKRTGTNTVSTPGYNSKFVFSEGVKATCEGDILNLLGLNETYEPQSYQFAGLFLDCTGLISTPLISSLTKGYYSMCEGMFKGCTSLVETPEFPIVDVYAASIYESMFSGCTSLTVIKDIPDLPTSPARQGPFKSMFEYCTSLKRVSKVPYIEEMGNQIYSAMFMGCTELEEAPALPNLNLSISCYVNMFNGCTKLTQAPILPASVLKGSCYKGMFRNCSSLNRITMLATDISADSCLSNWVWGVAATGTFIKSSAMTTLPTGYSGIPNGWTVENYQG